MNLATLVLMVGVALYSALILVAFFLYGR